MNTSTAPTAPATEPLEPRRTWAPSRWNRPSPGNSVEPETAFGLGNRLHHLATTAYPIGHGQTFRPYRVSSEGGEVEAFLEATYSDIDRMGLYVHVPFCERRCRYCEYAVVQSPTDADKEEYVRALCVDLARTSERLGARKRLVGLDIGGGTPALLAPSRIGQILEGVDRGFDRAEGFGVSIETTPAVAAVGLPALRTIRGLGIERISMGVQAADHRLLHAMERVAGSLDDNIRAAANVRRAGFRELNVDVMYGFAGQSVEAWEETLRHAVALEPDCITTYRVRFKGTRIEHDAGRVTLEAVNRLYEATGRVLGAAGYHAAPGKNTYTRRAGSSGLSAYLEERVLRGTPYLGVGLGAQSFTGNLLAYNLGAASKSLTGYLDAVRAGRLPLQDVYFLPRREGMAKMISVSMYAGGVNLQAFEDLFGVPLEESFRREVGFVVRNGLMVMRDGALRLTAEGARGYHGCLALFYSDAVKQHLLEMAGCEARPGMDLRGGSRPVSGVGP